MPYEKAAEQTNKADLTDPEEELCDDLPDGFRIVKVLPDGSTQIEREVTTGDAWAEMAKFTHPNASYEWANEIAKGLSTGDYRVVFDWNRSSSGEWLLEKRVSE